MNTGAVGVATYRQRVICTRTTAPGSSLTLTCRGFPVSPCELVGEGAPRRARHGHRPQASENPASTRLLTPRAVKLSLPREPKMSRRGPDRGLVRCWRTPMAPPSDQYDHEHQKRRAELLPGAYNTPCPLCGKPMLKGQNLDLDHSVPHAVDSNSKGDRIVHADSRDCPAGGNRSEGGKLGARQVKFRPSRSW